MTRYQPRLPITLQNVQVLNQSARIVLKNVSFLGIKDPSPGSDARIEAKLLENLGQLIASVLESNIAPC